ncbi:MAG: energy transducer TonB [Mameliella sp.]|nr:energy transducer TonB [Mameliella sp.]
MIRSSQAAKAVALSTAIAVHGALALALSVPETVKTEGADGAVEVRLGNAFQDMAAGTLTPDPSDTIQPDDVTKAAEPEQTDRTAADVPDEARPDRPTDRLTAALANPVTPDRPETVTTTPPPEAAKQVTPVALAPDMADGTLARNTAEIAKPLPPERADQTTPKTVKPMAPKAASPVAPATVTAAAPKSAPVPTKPESATAVRPESATPHAEVLPEKLSSKAPESAAVTRSLRPKQRSTEFEKAHKPAPKPKPVKQAKTPTKQPQGGAPHNARAGSTTGKAAATARQSGSGGRTKEAGNAAASNYPGLVMRRLSRAGKPNISARGTAVVTFSISSGGGLASVSLAQSSGSSALDRAAVRLVRGAGPFPKPPQGARRSFSVRIQGR